MKGKENKKHKSSQNRSASYDQRAKKGSLSSAIYESSRNSLCSPRINKSHNPKFNSYMQYISSGKFTPQPTTSRTNAVPARPRTATPTPRRLPACLIQQGRRSVFGKEDNSKDFRKSMKPKQGSKTPRENTKTFFMKGSTIAKGNTSGEELRKKQGHLGKKKSVLKDATKASTKNVDKVEQREKKLIQKLFAGIQFHRQLGRGAHAVVKCGVDFNKQQKIAVKIYQKRELTSEELKSIEREVEILGSLDHQSIIKLYQIIETIKTINLVMEYGGGNSLEQYIRNRTAGKLEESEARTIFKSLVSGMVYLHKKGVAHRDIKTENILLNKYLQVKVIDFGFSHRRKTTPNGELQEQLTTTYCGTPTYMAPEIVTRKPHCPIQADLWSLGILLYNMLHGHCPFKAQNQKQLFKRICEGGVQFKAQVSEEARELILGLLSAVPEKRPSADQIARSAWMSE